MNNKLNENAMPKYIPIGSSVMYKNEKYYVLNIKRISVYNKFFLRFDTDMKYEIEDVYGNRKKGIHERSLSDYHQSK